MSLGYLIMYIFNVMIELIEGYFNKIILSKFFSGRWNYVSAGSRRCSIPNRSFKRSAVTNLAIIFEFHIISYCVVTT